MALPKACLCSATHESHMNWAPSPMGFLPMSMSKMGALVRNPLAVTPMGGGGEGRLWPLFDQARFFHDAKDVKSRDESHGVSQTCPAHDHAQDCDQSDANLDCDLSHCIKLQRCNMHATRGTSILEFQQCTSNVLSPRLPRLAMIHHQFCNNTQVLDGRWQPNSWDHKPAPQCAGSLVMLLSPIGHTPALARWFFTGCVHPSAGHAQLKAAPN